ncbi:MAG: fibrobacter succinogenes major paralogous domain-containing protein [Candidatus Kapabacteria bacterium]|nr:fibrobacter succinogenes major paralogous domain-containing protein [Candidatus Kapabacteria bacterium]
MKKIILILFVFLSALSINAQEPVIKIYMNDGSSKQYKINDIADLSFVRTNLSYSMTVYQSKLNSKSDFDIKTIDSIEFENNQTMNIIQSDITNSFIISDIDSIIFDFNTCTEIQIGSQIWMCRNLDVDHYRNGDSIPQVTNPTQWANLKTGAWCYYNNDPANGAVYGKLYNWYAVNDPRGLAPAGWHVPSDAEWATLISYLGGDIVAGGKMKETGTMHWLSPNEGATNSSSFTALPGGCRVVSSGGFFSLRYGGFWWSASEYDEANAWVSYLDYYNTNNVSYYDDKVFGFSVRCVKD